MVCSGIRLDVCIALAAAKSNCLLVSASSRGAQKVWIGMAEYAMNLLEPD